MPLLLKMQIPSFPPSSHFLIEVWPHLQTSSLKPAHLSPDSLPSLLGPSQDSRDTSPNKLGALSSINRTPDASLFIVINDGARLLVVCRQALLKGFGVIVRTLDEGFACDVVRHVLLGRVD